MRGLTERRTTGTPPTEDAARGYRIALLPSAYAPAVGGVEVLTARLAYQLRELGHAVEVWAPRDAAGSLPEREVIDGTPVRRFVFAMPRLDPLDLARTPFRAVRTLRALRAAAAGFKPTHLHVQCFSGNGAYATMLSALTGLPLVVTLQGETVMDDDDIYGKSFTLRSALRLGLRRAAVTTGCSQFTLDDAHQRFGLDPAKARVIFNGADPDETDPLPVDLPFRRYVLALGRVVRNKGFDLLLDAFATIAAHHSDVGLVIGGSGPELGRLREQTERLGLSTRVCFPGRLDRGQVATAMAGADVFVMPSRLEPFGIVALEAWRAGTPAIVTSVGGASEFVQHEVTGLVADPTNRSELSRAIARLLDDADERRRLGAAGRSALERFTWAELAHQYEAVYAATATPGRRVGRVPSASGPKA